MLRRIHFLRSRHHPDYDAQSAVERELVAGGQRIVAAAQRHIPLHRRANKAQGLQVHRYPLRQANAKYSKDATISVQLPA